MKKSTAIFGTTLAAVLTITGITTNAQASEQPPKDPTKITSVVMPGVCSDPNLYMQVIWQHSWNVTPSPASPNYWGNRVWMVRLDYKNPVNGKSKQYKYPQIQSISLGVFWDKPGVPIDRINRRDLRGSIHTPGGALNTGAFVIYPQSAEDNPITTDVLNAIRWVPSDTGPSVQMKASREVMGRKGKYTEKVYCESYADGRKIMRFSQPQPGPQAPPKR